MATRNQQSIDTGNVVANDLSAELTASCGSRDQVCGDLIRHGGPVMHNAKNFLIFWLPAGEVYDTDTSNANYEQLIIRYFTDICTTNPLYWLVQQYSDASGPPGSCSLGGYWVDPSSSYPSYNLSRADIQKEVVNAQLTQNWPANNGNNEFFVFTGQGIASSDAPEACAYHSWFTPISSQPVVYALILDSSPSSLCSVKSSPNGDLTADSAINISSHEQLEAVTDPNGTGYFFDSDPYGHEIGDECAWIFGPAAGATFFANGNSYRLQREWSNSIHGCAIHPGSSVDVCCAFAKVVGQSPSGTISWSSNSSAGQFLPSAQCTLLSASQYGSCGVSYIDRAPALITAVYSGDQNNPPSAGTVTMGWASQSGTTTDWSCNDVRNTGLTTYCSFSPLSVANITQTAGPGKVYISPSHCNGGNPPPTCTFTVSLCPGAFNATCVTPGDYEITVSQGGDSNFLPSSKSQADFVAVSSGSANFYCGSPIAAGRPDYCSVTVPRGNGTVTLTSSSSSGAFQQCATGPGCYSSNPTYVCPSGVGTCTARYRDASVGSVTITETYSGDSNIHPFTATVVTNVIQGPDLMTGPNCGSSGAFVNTPITCYVGISAWATPTGTVNWSSTSNSVSFSSATCTVNVYGCGVNFTDTSAGSAIITAAYLGDAKTLPAAGSSSVVVFRESTATTLTCDPYQVLVDSSMSCTVRVQGRPQLIHTAPSGNVSLSTSGPGSFTPTSQCKLDMNGTCNVNYTPAPGSRGPQNINATFAGDQGYLASSSRLTITVITTQRTTSTSLVCNPDLPVNSPTNCTVTVIDNDTGTPVTPTGSVATNAITISFGSFSGSTCDSISASGSSATCDFAYTPGLGSEGMLKINATYLGDPHHLPSTGQTTKTVTSRKTSTSLACNPSTAPVNFARKCSARVADTDIPTAVTPTGDCLFSIIGQGLLTIPTGVPVASGYCEIAFTPDFGTDGVYTINATYSGDADHASSWSSYVLTVTGAQIIIAPGTGVPGSPVTVTGSGFRPSETVTIKYAGAILGTVTSDNTGSFTSTFTVPVSPLGSQSITATGSYRDATTASFGVEIYPSFTINPTVTTVSCNTSSTTVCTATVEANITSTPLTPMGKVTFSDTGSGSFSPSSCNLNGISQYVTCSVAYVPSSPSSETITASYSGDAYHLPSCGATTTGSGSGTVVSFCAATTVSSGSLSSDQTANTGTSVRITGSTAPSGTSVTVTTARLASPGSGVNNVNLNNAQYFDVKIKGIIDGTARVCLHDPSANSATTMRYWSGTTWTSALGISVSGSLVCGDIPVSALTHTDLAVGDMSSIIEWFLSPPRLEFVLAGIAVIALLAFVGIYRRRRTRLHSFHPST